MWNAVFKPFLRVFAETRGLLVQIPKLVMSLDFFQKNANDARKKQNAVLKKKEVILSRIK